MQTFDLAVVGSGIGGSLIAALNAEKNIALFEKDKNLGGCASTFKRFGNHYNTGATTLVGYEDNHVLKKHFDSIGLKPKIPISKFDGRCCYQVSFCILGASTYFYSKRE